MNTTKNHNAIFVEGTVRDWQEAARAPLANPDRDNEHASHARMKWSWYGCTASQYDERERTGWTEAAETIAELPEVSGPAQTAVMQRVWNEEDGDDGDYERYLNEQPFLYRRKKAPRVNGATVHTAKIRVDLSESFHVDAQTMIWKAYTAVRIADTLEALNVRCEIIAEGNLRDFERGTHRNAIYKVTVKNPDEPVNIGQLANALSPWFFRRTILLALNAKHETRKGSGFPTSIETTQEPATLEIIIPRRTITNKAQAEYFIHELKINER